MLRDLRDVQTDHGTAQIPDDLPDIKVAGDKREVITTHPTIPCYRSAQYQMNSPLLRTVSGQRGETYARAITAQCQRYNVERL